MSQTTMGETAWNRRVHITDKILPPWLEIERASAQMSAVEKSKEFEASEWVSSASERTSVSFFSLYRLNAVIPLKVINNLINPEWIFYNKRGACSCSYENCVSIFFVLETTIYSKLCYCVIRIMDWWQQGLTCNIMISRVYLILIMHWVSEPCKKSK